MVVNPEDIDLGDGMEEDDEADEPAAEVQLQQKAVPVRLASAACAYSRHCSPPKLLVANVKRPEGLHLTSAYMRLCLLTQKSMP